ncbi:MAG: SIMPL domain-containing protein [Flavobacteriales bacterium]|nr:SIMPL domain-containing protein [Flavobacteriales bacterium]
MTLRYKLITALLLFTTLFVSGQPITPNTPKTENIPYIEVTGYAENEIIPDEIFIGFSLRERYEGRIKITISEQEEKLKSALEAIGIDLKNLFLSDVNAGYIKITWQKKDVLTKKDYTLKVGDASTLSLVFQEFEKLSISGAKISKVSHSNIENLKKDLRIKAIKIAKEKADYLLEAIGEQTGKPLIITESVNEAWTKIDIAKMPSRSVGELYLGGTPADLGDTKEIEFQKIKLTSTIYVKFSIK